jgi:hypothetical protein
MSENDQYHQQLVRHFNDKHHKQPARYLCAAYIAHRAGIGLTYALKTYVKDDPGSFWIDLAKQVDRAMMDHMNEIFKPPEPQPGIH